MDKQYRFLVSKKKERITKRRDPILIKTCLIKNFKFIKTSYPDYVGRYVYSEHEVYRSLQMINILKPQTQESSIRIRKN